MGPDTPFVVAPAAVGSGLTMLLTLVILLVATPGRAVFEVAERRLLFTLVRVAIVRLLGALADRALGPDARPGTSPTAQSAQGQWRQPVPQQPRAARASAVMARSPLAGST